jgi:hypothetical protein
MTAHGTVVLPAGGWRRLGRPREGDEGVAGQSGRVGRMPLGLARTEKKRDGPEGRLGRNDFWAALRKRKRFFRF